MELGFTQAGAWSEASMVSTSEVEGSSRTYYCPGVLPRLREHVDQIPPATGESIAHCK